MEAIPKEQERRSKQKKGGAKAREVVQVLDREVVQVLDSNQNRSTNVKDVKNLNGMHAQPGKRLDVSVPMVYCVDMLVQGTDVDEPGSVSLCLMYVRHDMDDIITVVYDGYPQRNRWKHRI